MKNNLFLRVLGTLIPTETPEDLNEWRNPFSEEALIALRLVCDNLDCHIILLDIPEAIDSGSLVNKFGENNLDLAERIIGRVVSPLLITQKILSKPSSYSMPYPITIGNSIRHYIENFLERPFNYPTENKVDYEVWEYPNETNELEKPEFRGMQFREHGKDFQYAIIGEEQDILLSQKDRAYAPNPKYGLNKAVVGTILAYF